MASYWEDVNWTQDFTYALRMIRKQPWFSAAIVLTLALGIGSNTTVFTLVNAVLIKPLPFPGGERIVTVTETDLPRGRQTIGVSLPDYRDFRKEAKSFDFLEAFSGEAVNISDNGGAAERYRGAMVTGGFFELIGLKPVLGRPLSEADTKPGADPVILLGHGIWKDRYGLDPTIVGRAIRVNDHARTVIGVMGEGFRYPTAEQAWLPMIADAQLEKRDNRRLMMIGRMREEAGMAVARAELEVVARRLGSEYPATHKGVGVTVRTFNQTFNGGNIRVVFLLMLGAVGFVLLIACANVANMLLSRSVGRVREVSIRAALGASRWRIIRQLLVESVMLSAAGGLAGLALSYGGVAAVAAAVANVDKPAWIDFSMDYRVFGYFAVVSVMSGILFGLAPALQSAKADLNETLKDGARTAGTAGGWMSGVLVVFQFMLAMVLLAGAGLMIRSFLKHQDVYTRYGGDGVLTARINLPDSRYAKLETRTQFYDGLIARVGGIPGVASVSLTTHLPLSGANGDRFEVEGQPPPDKDRRPALHRVMVTEQYLPSIGVPVLQGRNFESTDGLAGKEAAIVSRQLAERHWAGTNAVGKRLRIFRDQTPGPWLVVVGVIPDIPTEPAQSDRANLDPLILVPYRQDNPAWAQALIRTKSGDPMTLAPMLRRELKALDADLPLYQVRSLTQYFRQGGWYLRVFGSLFGIFALIALSMAGVGIYAVMAQATSRRTQEIGVRMALGAGAGEIFRLVLRRGTVQLAVGIGLGLGLAFAVTRLMSRLLFDITPNDALTFSVITGLLAGAGLIACLLPARKAAALDPVKALRYE